MLLKKKSLMAFEIRLAWRDGHLDEIQAVSNGQQPQQ